MASTGSTRKLEAGKAGAQRSSQASNAFDGARIAVGAENFVACAQQIDEVAAGAAAGIQDSHARGDAAAQQLIEQIDVDRAELFLESRGQYLDADEIVRPSARVTLRPSAECEPSLDGKA